MKLKPHRTRGWINPSRGADFAATCGDVCKTYELALPRAAAGVETRSIDEMTRVQALERAAPTQAKRPGQPERTEFEYIRHGTRTLIADFDVATGVVGYHLGPKRAEDDVARYLATMLATRTPKTYWHLVDPPRQLNLGGRTWMRRFPASSTSSTKPWPSPSAGPMSASLWRRERPNGLGTSTADH